jgi:hypothetical protein
MLQSAGDLAHFREAQEARRLAKQQYEDNERAIEDKQWATVRDWLSPPDHEVEHRALKDRRSGYPGTTDWIFTDSSLKDWLQSTVSGTSVLWLCGIPGAGVSTYPSFKPMIWGHESNFLRKIGPFQLCS